MLNKFLLTEVEKRATRDRRKKNHFMSIRSVYLYGKWVYVGGCYTLYYYNSILIENYWTNAFSVCWPCSIHSATTRISNQFSYTSQIDHNRRILHLIPGFGMWVIVRMWFFFFNIGRRQFFSIGHTTFVEVVVLYRLVVLGWCSWAQTPKKRYFHWLFFFSCAPSLRWRK